MRKNFAKLGALVGGLALAATLAGTGAAFATPGNGNGAVVQHNAYGAINCFVTDGSGGFWLIDNCTVNIVTTPDGTVNETLKGTVDSSTPPPAHAFTGSTATTGERCDLMSGAVNIVSETVTPSGNFTAKCTN